MPGKKLSPPPTFSLMQIRERVVCLVLDVSENMAKVITKDHKEKFIFDA